MPSATSTGCQLPDCPGTPTPPAAPRVGWRSGASDGARCKSVASAALLSVAPHALRMSIAT
eukprot:13731749-Alexandrium_andersonii.AAC.1